MRDHSLALSPIAEALQETLQETHQVLVPDLRGHGLSSKPGLYAMVHFVSDVLAVLDAFEINRCVLVGHSLGGHIAGRFAAAFPERVSRLALLDGMGPPRAAVDPESDPRQLGLRSREGAEGMQALPSGQRRMNSVEEAVDRLMRNNVGLSPEHAGLIATEGVEPHPDGGVQWRWDAAVSIIWHTFSHRETELMWETIGCPVLVVTGDRGLDYWVAMRPEMDDQAHYESELARRTAIFPDATHQLIAGAGHMLHYDQPQRLVEVLNDFIEPSTD